MFRPHGIDKRAGRRELGDLSCENIDRTEQQSPFIPFTEEPFLNDMFAYAGDLLADAVGCGDAQGFLGSKVCSDQSIAVTVD